MHNEWKGQQGLFEGLSGGFSDLSPISPRVPLNVQAKVLAAREELLVPGTELFCGDEDGIPCHGPGCVNVTRIPTYFTRAHVEISSLGT